LKIILFENTNSLNSTIRTFLLSKGHRVEHYGSVADCFNIVNTSVYDCIIFDMDVFSAKKFDCLKTNRAIYPMKKILPIIHHNDVETLKDLFSLGYTHYIKKPFTIHELELHLNRINTLYKVESTLSKCDYSFNLKSCTLIYDNNHYIFTKNQASFISLLISKKNEIVTPSEISLCLWDKNINSYTTIRSLIAKTKKKLPKPFIKNHRGVGYMWVDIAESQ
jgi:DNA-binding response OmpR family regulator